MTISLQLALDGSEKENVKAVLLTQNGSDVARWGENGSNLQDSVTVQAVEMKFAMSPLVPVMVNQLGDEETPDNEVYGNR